MLLTLIHACWFYACRLFAPICRGFIPPDEKRGLMQTPHGGLTFGVAAEATTGY